MRWFVLAMVSLCFAAPVGASVREEQSTAEPPLLPWTTDFDKALDTAKTDSIPLYVYFTGSSWCIWCKKMDREFHSQDAFRQKMVGKVLFVKVDLPAGSPPNERAGILMGRYRVQGVPTVLILSPSGEELGRFRYQQMPPEEYAEAVLKVAYPKNGS